MSEYETSDSQHLLEALLQKEALSRELFEATHALEQEITGWLIPTIQRRRGELARLQGRLRAIGGQDQAATGLPDLERQMADIRQEIERLRTELAHARTEISTLRQSRSWRMTAPLRAVYDLLQQLLGSGAAAATGAVDDSAGRAERHRR